MIYLTLFLTLVFTCLWITELFYYLVNKEAKLHLWVFMLLACVGWVTFYYFAH
jgi:hypothetical protein